MKHLIIDGKDYGLCDNYKQDREGPAKGWIFIMATGIETKVPFSLIKSFTSHDSLEIITFMNN